jgi:hypothetical protein
MGVVVIRDTRRWRMDSRCDRTSKVPWSAVTLALHFRSLNSELTLMTGPHSSSALHSPYGTVGIFISKKTLDSTPDTVYVGRVRFAA